MFTPRPLSIHLNKLRIQTRMILLILIMFLFANLTSLTFAIDNTPPTFLDTPTHFIAITDYDFDLIPLLHVSDPDANQSFTWSVEVAPLHGEISLVTPTWGTPGNDIYPMLDTITYCATLGYTGPDTFTMKISDGYSSTTRVFTVTVYSEYDQWDGSRATSFAGGTGTQADPYLIATGAQLAYLSDFASAAARTGPMAPGLHFKLIADIDLSGREWTPIGVKAGVYTYPFSGNIHGNGHSIYNLTIGSALAPNPVFGFLGLIGYAHDTSIDNLALVDVSIYNALTESYIGGLVGYMTTTPSGVSLLERCSVSGTISIADQSMGGLLSGAYIGQATECSTAGSVFAIGPAYTGGLFGYVDPRTPISNCFTTASIIVPGGAGSKAGGLAGYGSLNAEVPKMFFNCYATGNLISKGIGDFGLLVGNYSSTNPVLDSCYFNSTAVFVNNGIPIPAKGLGVGVDTGIAKTLDEIRLYDFVTTLNSASTVIWVANIPVLGPAQHLGLPELRELPRNLGDTLERITYHAIGASSGYVPQDTGAYPVGATIPLAYNVLALDKGDEYDFLGWNTKVDGSGTDYAELADYVVTATNDLYATWLDVDPNPVITQVDYPGTGHFIAGDVLVFYVSFDQPVTVTGELNLLINFGKGEFPIALSGGSGTNILRFRYPIVAGDESLGAIQMGSLSLAADASITDDSGQSADLTYHNVIYREVYVDAVVPTITAISLLGAAPHQYIGGDVIQVQMTFNEPVSLAEDAYYIQLTLENSSGIYANYVSGSGSNTLIFEKRLDVADITSTGLVFEPYIFWNIPISDFSGNEASYQIPGAVIPGLSTVTIDTRAPFVLSVTPSAANQFKVGENIDLSLTFSKAVFVTEGLTLPHVLLNIDTPTGSSTQTAWYIAGSGSSTLQFQLALTEPLYDMNGISLNPTLQILDAKIQDASERPTNLAIPAVDLSLKQVDTIAPFFTALSLTDLPGKTLFASGDTMHFQLQLSEPAHLMNWDPGWDGYLHLYFKQADFNDKINCVLVPYTSGSGTATWNFAYTVQAGDVCTGTAILDSRIFANRMTFYDYFNNSFDGNFDNLTLDLTSVVIDGVSPQVTSMMTPAANTYITGQNLDFIVQFDDIVQSVAKVDGAGDYPVAMKLYLESGTVFAPLAGYWDNTNSQISATPTSDLLFRYTISNTDFDTDGISLTNMQLVLAEPYLHEGTHSLVDLIGNPALLSLPNANTSGIKIVEPLPAPYVTSVWMQENVYALGDTLDIQVTYDQPVFLTGGLDMNISLGLTGKLAACTSGSGTDTLHFTYTIQAGDAGMIGVSSPIELGSGSSLTNATLAAVNLELNNIRIINVSADAVAPGMNAMEVVPYTGRFTYGQSIMFKAAFTEPCNLDISLGEPQLLFKIGDQARTADYDADHGDGSNGYVAFRYDIFPGDYGAVQLPVAITPNGAVLSDDFGNVAGAEVWTLNNPNDLSNLFIDTLPPEVTSVALLGTAPYAYKQGDTLAFEVVFNEAVTVYDTSTPMLKLTLEDNSNAFATYSSGSGTNTLLFECNNLLPDKYSEGIALSTTVELGVAPPTDAVGNRFTGVIADTAMPDTSGVIIDSQAPTILFVTFQSDWYYGVGDSINASLVFSEPVLVGAGSIKPTLLLTINTPFGTSIETSAYVEGSGTDTLLFRCRLSAGLSDYNGIDINPNLQIFDAQVTDAVGNPTETLLPAVDLTPYRIDTIEPYVEAVYLTDLPDKTLFGIGETLHFQVKWNEPASIGNVFIGPDPQAFLHLYLDAFNYVAVPYISGSRSDTWEFAYTVENGNVSNLIWLEPRIYAITFFYDGVENAIDGSFEDTVVEDLGEVVIDGQYAQATQWILPTNGSYYAGQVLNFVVRYDEIVQSVVKEGGVGSYPFAIELYLDSGTVYVPFTGYWNATTQTVSATTPTTDLLFRYTVGANDLDADGIALRPLVFDLSEPYLVEGTHTLNDLAGNPALLTLPNTDVSGIKLVAPPPPVVEEPVVEPTKPTDASPDQVLVNGDPNPIATLSRQGENQNQQVLRVDAVETRTLLEQTAKNILFTLPFEQTSPQYAGELNGETVKLMEERNTIVQIQTPLAKYTIPAKQLNIAKVGELFGSGADLKNIEVRIEVKEPAENDVQFVQDVLRKNKITLVVQPMEFTITCNVGENVVKVERFTSYVERLIAIPEGVDPKEITTAVVLHKDGKVGHVPTTIVVIDGKYYAKINSLTNSIYTLVQNAVEYTDTTTHWAKAAIEDMSGRLIVEAVLPGEFMPDQRVNRSEFVSMLVKALGLDESVTASMAAEVAFSDVTAEAGFAGAIAKAKEYGLVYGDGFGHFNPYDEITREQVVALLARAMELAGKTIVMSEREIQEQLSVFGDAASVHDYAKVAVAYGVREGLVEGRLGNIGAKAAAILAPTATITRAEAAALLQRTLQHCGLID